MLQVIQPIDGRATEVVEVPAPSCPPRHVLIANACSLISAGTERAVVSLARRSVIGKARERPDQVRRVLAKVRSEGVAAALRQVGAKISRPIPLGYSSAGVVIGVGEGVEHYKIGDRVASNGPHAGVVAVGQNLTARVPDGVPFDHACYAVVGAIALQGVRLAEVGLGAVVGVVGLGLIGQFAVGLLRASGCTVVGTDPDPERCAMALARGAAWAGADGMAEAVVARTQGRGADAVLITASARSDGPLRLAARVARRKARLVAVGAVGLNVDRREFYPKELELVVSCSYGPGRYDRSYEEQGVDYPYAHVRWTEQRNIQAVLDLMGSGGLDIRGLTTNRFAVERAVEAYELIRIDRSALGVVLDYPAAPPDPPRRVTVARPAAGPALGPPPKAAGRLRVGFLGAGDFASAVLLPALARRHDLDLRLICSGGGLSARALARRHGIRWACSDDREVLADSEIDAVFIATRHDLHAGLLLGALRAGKHVFVEKPLAIRPGELDEIEAYLAGAGVGRPCWTVGFNRRFSQAARAAREHFAGVDEPLTAVYRFNAGPLPPDHWAHDPDVGGGRIVGEACHAIDLLTFLLGALPERVFAEATGAGDRSALTLRHANGGVSTLLYTGGGDHAFAKERVEVFGAGRVAVIDDFRRVETARDGRLKARRWRGQDKGHAAEVAAFVEAVRAGGPGPIPEAELIATSRAALAALESARAGKPVEVRP
jgi:predicted dehydrogenase